MVSPGQLMVSPTCLPLLHGKSNLLLNNDTGKSNLTVVCIHRATTQIQGKPKLTLLSSNYGKMNRLFMLLLELVVAPLSTHTASTRVRLDLSKESL